MRFVKLTEVDMVGKPTGEIWVNPDHIAAMVRGTKTTLVRANFTDAGGVGVTVRETPEQIQAECYDPN